MNYGMMQEAVANGAALLDERVPNWPDKIDLSTLRLQSLVDCVLGQLFGDYLSGKDALGINGYCIPIQLGFYPSEDDEDDSLTDAWVDYILPLQTKRKD